MSKFENFLLFCGLLASLLPGMVIKREQKSKIDKILNSGKFLRAVEESFRPKTSDELYDRILKFISRLIRQERDGAI